MKMTLHLISSRRFLTVAALLAPLLLAGCEGSVSDSVGSIISNPFGSSEDSKKDVINVVDLNAQEIPWHIQSTVAATVLRLMNEEPETIDTQFSLVGSAGIATDENSSLAGFGVQNVQINDFFRPEDAPEVNRLGARLILVDPTGRRLGVSFVADYEIIDDKVILKGHQWGYARAEAQVLVPIEYTGFLWAALFGWLQFSEEVGIATVGGALLIVVGCLIGAKNAKTGP